MVGIRKTGRGISRVNLFIYWKIKMLSKNFRYRDFSSGWAVKNPSCNSGDMGSIPGWGTKIPHDSEQLRTHTPQLKNWCVAMEISCATTKTGCRKINNFLKKFYFLAYFTLYVYNGLLDSEGEGEGGMIWENGILTCILSCKNWIASLCLTQDIACLGLVHGDDPERCYGEGGGRRFMFGNACKN